MKHKEDISFIADRLIAYAGLFTAMVGTLHIAEGDMTRATEAYLATIATALLYVASRMLQVETRLNDDEDPPNSAIIDDLLHGLPVAIFLGLGKALSLANKSNNNEEFIVVAGVSVAIMLNSLLQTVKESSR